MDRPDSRPFLRRLWDLENAERPGFMIGYLGPRVTGGSPVKSALFSTDGPDKVRDRLLDPEKFLLAQLEEAAATARFRGDYVPSLCPAFGVVGISSAFGCEVVWWERDLPALRPLPLESPEDVFTLRKPRPTDGVVGKALEYTRHFIARTDGEIPIRLTDIQGPLDNAALIMGHSAMLMAMKTHPGAVHYLLRMVTDFTIDVVKAHRDIVRGMGAEFVPSLMQPWLPDGMGVAVSNDECVMISAAQHDEFSVPYLNILSEEFGGVYVHSCGNWAHQLPSLDNVRLLRGLEFGASEAPFLPVVRHFAGRTVLAARVGLHRDLKFQGMSDFIQRLRAASSTSRGLFLHVDITNGIVDDDWPVSDVEQIYALLEE